MTRMPTPFFVIVISASTIAASEGTHARAFTKTWEYLANGKNIDNIRAFVYRTANNLIIDRAERKRSLS